jgi:hypothetical protein
LFLFRFCAVHPKEVRDCQLQQFFEVVPVGNPILLATDIESSDAPALCESFLA